MEIVQIVPRLPPEFCGVGDYARLLTGAMMPLGIQTRFLVGDPAWRGETTLDGCEIEVLGERTSKALQQELEATDCSQVFLHYVGYGYEPYGTPQWLLEGLQSWRASNPSRRLTTMFHESYASGLPWTRAFWSSGQQKRIAAGVAQLSDGCRTNMNYIARRLEKLAPRHQNRVEVAPVFSTVGEPAIISPLCERKPQMALFGSAAWRRQAYFEHREELLRACEKLGLESIIDIGKPFEGEVDLPLPLMRAGALPAPEVSRLLGESRAGFLTYPERFFGKSTIFAAYCAHGMVPICAGSRQNNEDGLEVGTHFWRSRNTIPSEAQVVADAAGEWYDQHSLAMQAADSAKSLTS